MIKWWVFLFCPLWKLFSMFNSIISPGQGCLTHDWFCVAFDPLAVQLWPPCAGIGLSHNRTLIWSPIPQVTGQVLQLPQSPQFPSTIQKRRGKLRRISKLLIIKYFLRIIEISQKLSIQFYFGTNCYPDNELYGSFWSCCLLNHYDCNLVHHIQALDCCNACLLFDHHFHKF